MAKPTEAAFKADLALEAQPASSRTSTKGNAVEHPPTVPEAMEYDYSNFYFGAGTDPFAIFKPFDDWWREVQPSAYYLFELPLHSAPGTRMDVRAPAGDGSLGVCGARGARAVQHLAGVLIERQTLDCEAARRETASRRGWYRSA